MKAGKLKTFLILSVAVLSMTGAWASDYIVQSGDTLSSVAHQIIPGQVWGKQGSVAQVLALNPQIKNPNLILVGQEIKLPQTTSLAKNESSKSRAPASENLPADSVAQPEAKPLVAPPDTLPITAAEFQEHSALTLAPLFSFSRISATDRANGTQSTLGSALNLGAQLGWRQYWSPGFQTALVMSAVSNSYSTTSSTQSLDHSSFLLGSVELEGRWGRLASPEFFACIGAIQTPFIRGESATANILDVVSTPNVGLGFALPIYHSQVFLMSFEATGDYLAPSSQSSYTVNSGYDVGGKLALSQHSKKSLDQKIEGDLFFKYLDQNTSITTQNTMELGASLQFNFDLFGAETK